MGLGADLLLKLINDKVIQFLTSRMVDMKTELAFDRKNKVVSPLALRDLIALAEAGC